MSSIWYAQPSGGYLASSPEGTSNIRATYDYLYGEGFVYGSVVGMLCNVAGESGYNPWRWQNDTVDTNAGYGLVQFTPASAYVYAAGIPDHAPNMSTSMQTAGASPDDGKGQLYCIVNDVFGKWNSSCWRSYWDPSTYPTLYSRSQNILSLYGQGGSLSISDFAIINDIDDACFAFLACYEGPAVPNFDARVANKSAIETALQGYIPDPPGPPGTRMDILFLKHFIDKNHKRGYII